MNRVLYGVLIIATLAALVMLLVAVLGVWAMMPLATQITGLALVLCLSTVGYYVLSCWLIDAPYYDEEPLAFWFGEDEDG